MRIAVLYDGACGLCQRSVTLLQRLDWFHHLLPIDFRNEKMRKEIVPDIPLEALDRSMHIRFLSERTENTFQGFDAFRALTWYLPALWPIAPLLYFPGVAPVGRMIYARIARHRLRCTDGVCIHTHS
ncbi:MAG: DUF393 domain-containing protein [Patescibacteria group bacterium]